MLSLTHWGRVTHICVGKLIILGSDNGLSPARRQAIIWTNTGILLIGPLGTNFSEVLIGVQTCSFKKMHLKMSSVKWRLVCLGLNDEPAPSRRQTTTQASYDEIGLHIMASLAHTVLSIRSVLYVIDTSVLCVTAYVIRMSYILLSNGAAVHMGVKCGPMLVVAAHSLNINRSDFIQIWVIIVNQGSVLIIG